MEQLVKMLLEKRDKLLKIKQVIISDDTVNDYIKAHRVSSNPSQPINNSHTTPSYIPRQNSIGSIAVQPVSRSNIYRDR